MARRTPPSGRALSAARRLRVAAAVAIGVIGAGSTALSLGPSAITVVSTLSPATLPLALPAFTLAALCLSVPILIALSIGNAGRRWWLWLALAVAAAVLVLVLRTSVGSLGVWWLTALP